MDFQKELRDALSSIKSHENYAFDLETTGLDPYKSKILIVSLATEDGAWVLPFEGDHALPYLATMQELNDKVFGDPDKIAITWNGEFDVRHLIVHGTKFRNKIADGMVARWLCDETLAQRKMLGLKKQVLINYNYDMDDIGSTNLLQGVVDAIAWEYARDDALYTYKIWHEKIAPEMTLQGLNKVYWRICSPIVRAIADMELNGICLDKDHLLKLEVDLAKEVEDYTACIRKIAEEDSLNPGSGKQLAFLLFEKLGMEVKRGHPYTKNGYWSTGVSDIKRYTGEYISPDGDDPVDIILKLRRSTKLLKTYVRPFMERIDDSHDGRIRTSFHQCGTKCVRHDTLIASDRGLVRIADLDSSLGPNKERSLKCKVASRGDVDRTSHIVHNGVRQTRIIKTRMGFDIEATLDHPLWTNIGMRSIDPSEVSGHRRDALYEDADWVPVRDLGIGDRVALKKDTNIFGSSTDLDKFTPVYRTNAKRAVFPTKLTPELAEFVGIYTADGSTHTANGGGSIRISNCDPAVRKRVTALSKLLFGVDASISAEGVSIISKQVVDYCRDSLKFQSGARNKEIPSYIRTSPRECVVGFLSGLYLDSTCLPDRFGVRLSTANEFVATWVHTQLLNLGIVASKRISGDLTVNQHVSGLSEPSHEYSVTATGENAFRLREIIRPIASKLITYFARDNIKVGRKNYTEYGDVVWVSIVGLDKSKADVWDLTVPSSHSFVGNGFVNHNTGRLSCVAGWTPVETSQGVVPIRDVRIGDLVRTHQGRFRRVNRTIIKGVDHMHDVVLSNGNILTCTTDHKLLTSKGTWVKLGDMIDVNKQVVDTRPAKHQAHVGSIQKSRIAYVGNYCQEAGDIISECSVCGEEASYEGRVLCPQEGKVLCLEDRRLESDEGQDRQEAPQLGRGVRESQGLPHYSSESETSVCTSSCYGEGPRAEEASRHLRCASYRRGHAKQRSQQFGAVHQDGASWYPLLAGRDGDCKIEAINYRGRFEVYDVTVDDDHSYCACGVYHHNSSKPNMQNIPTEEGMIRKAFIPPPGKKLIVADYSQLEMRVGGLLAKKRIGWSKVQEAYMNSADADLHEATRAQMEGLGVAKFFRSDPLCRRNAKGVNFGFFYGRSAAAFARDNEMDQSEAADLRHKFLNDLYPEIQAMQKYCAGQLVAKGYVTTITGRRRRYPEERGKSFQDVWWPAWQSWNATVQGSSQDIIQIAMRNLYESIMKNREDGFEFEGEKIPASAWEEVKMLIQVHDELVAEAPEEHAETIAKWIGHMMSTAVVDDDMIFPVEAGIGNSWEEAK